MDENNYGQPFGQDDDAQLGPADEPITGLGGQAFSQAPDGSLGMDGKPVARNSPHSSPTDTNPLNQNRGMSFDMNNDGLFGQEERP